MNHSIQEKEARDVGQTEAFADERATPVLQGREGAVMELFVRHDHQMSWIFDL